MSAIAVQGVRFRFVLFQAEGGGLLENSRSGQVCGFLREVAIFNAASGVGCVLQANDPFAETVRGVVLEVLVNGSWYRHAVELSHQMAYSLQPMTIIPTLGLTLMAAKKHGVPPVTDMGLVIQL